MKARKKGRGRTSVGRVSASSEALLLTVVDDGNPVRNERPSSGVGVGLEVLGRRRVPGLVVVVKERAEEGHVLRRGGHVVVSRREGGHASARVGKGIERLVVYGVAEDPVHDFGVGRDVVDTSVKDLSEGVDATGGGEAGPEVLSDVLDRVNSDTVDSEQERRAARISR